MNEERQQQFLATNCPFAEEGYPAVYVLDALDGDDLARFRAHLPTCPICTAEVATLGVTAAQLPFLAQHHKATVIDINPDASAISVIADYYLQGPSGIILPALVEALRRVE